MSPIGSCGCTVSCKSFFPPHSPGFDHFTRFLTCSAPIYAFAYFIQIILGTIVDSTALVFLLCAPPYLVSIFWTVGCAWLADRTHLRMPWMLLNAAVTLTGLLITAYSTNSGARYFGGKMFVIYTKILLIMEQSFLESAVVMQICPLSSPSSQTTSAVIHEEALRMAYSSCSLL